ncbi:extracellular solute-binding protein [Streptomyces sp. NPDC019224]|uniref:ABC transporter substrate-binding protein n=1 Tax=Streptomyces sp. NPDC019224 TaxID=3154484 RepID=UPI0033DD7C06
MSSTNGPVGKRSRRHLLRAAGGSVLALALLTACGEGGTSTTQGDAAGGKPVTLQVWGGGRNAQAVVDKFNATHPRITLEYTDLAGGPEGYTKLVNAIKSGNGPDLFAPEYQNLPDLVSQGYVQDLSAKFTPELKAKFNAQAMELATLGGKNWAVPMDIAPMVYFYRQDVFKKYGLTVPRTWSEFRAAAAKLKKADPEARLATFPIDDPSVVAGLSWQSGGTWFGTEGDTWKVGFADAGTTRTVDFWQDMLDDDLVAGKPYWAPTQAKDEAAGKVVSEIGATWNAAGLSTKLPDQKGKWAVAPLPTFDGKPASGMNGGSTFAVAKGSDHLDQGFEAAVWLTTHKDAWTTRLAEGTASSYPAATDMVAVAEKSYDASYYASDVYPVFREAADSLTPGWAFGPSMTATWKALSDPLGQIDRKGDIAGALREGQDATVRNLKDRGLNVSAG